MRLSILATLAALAVPLAHAQTALWNKVVHGPGARATTLGDGRVVTRGIALDASGNLFVVGAASNGANNDFVTTKLAAGSGAVLWQKTFNGAANLDDEALAVAVDASGAAIVVGHGFAAAGNRDVKVIKYAADGAVAWERSLDAGAADFAFAVAVDAAGNALVAGESAGTAGTDIKVYKLAAATGAPLWTRTLDYGGEDYIAEIAVDASGNVLGAGVSTNAAGNRDMRVFKLAAATGAVAWSQAYDGGGHDEALALALDAGGNAYVTGYSTVGTTPNVRTIKYTAAGTAVWQQAIAGGRDDAGVSIAVNAEGHPFVLARVMNAVGNYDFRTLRYSGDNGAVQWDRTFDGGVNEHPYQLALDGNGNVVVVGTSRGATSDWRALQYSAQDGTLMWQLAYSGTGGDADDAYGVARAAGALYIAGISVETGLPSGIRVVKLEESPAVIPAPPPTPIPTPGNTAGYTAGTPFAGDFNGDGTGDIAWQLADGRVVLTLMKGGTPTSITLLRAAGAGWSLSQVGDFNGDRTADILWQHADGRVELALMGAGAATASQELRRAGGGWTAVKLGDLNGDGRADIVWKHADGRVEVTLMNGLATLAAKQIQGVGSAFTVSHAGDLNGDGRADIVWRHTDGRVILWLMNGVDWTQSRTHQASGSVWTVQQLADFNGDGRADLVWRNPDGRTTIWLMDGVSYTASLTVQPYGSQWIMAHIGDLDGDGKADIAWRHPAGNIVTWTMNGLNYKSSRTQRPGGSGWSLAAVTDVSGDRKADLLWKHTDGTAEIWLMDGVQPASTATLK